MTWTVKTKNGMSVMKYLHILALGIVALAVSVPLMTNYCIDGVNVSFYLRRLQKICPAVVFAADNGRYHHLYLPMAT